MATSNRRLEAFTESELKEWFDLSKYSEASLPRRPAEWVPIVTARAHLLIWLDTGKLDKVLAEFEKLKGNPCQALDIDFFGNWGVSHSDRRSVRMVSMQMLSGMHASASVICADPSESYDKAWAKHSDDGKVGRFAHARIDLWATKAQILRDFELWLDDYAGDALVTNRTYSAASVANWVKDQWLPYADLQIFARAMGKRISPAVLLKLLGVETESPLPGDALRSPKRALEKFFNLKTATALQLAAGQTKRHPTPPGLVSCVADTPKATAKPSDNQFI